MKESFFLYLALIMTGMVITVVSGQNQAGADSQSNVNNLATGQSQVVTTFDTRYAGVKGHPYLFKQWVAGEIDYGPDQSGTVELKLDIYNQILFVKQRSSVRKVDLPNTIWETFVLETDGKTFMFTMVEYLDKKKRTQKGLFQIRGEGSWRYLTKHQKDFQEADYKGAYKPPEYQDEFVDRSADYILRPDETIHKYKKPNDLKKILGGHFTILEEYASQEGLDLRVMEDLIRSLQYLNTKH